MNISLKLPASLNLNSLRLLLVGPTVRLDWYRALAATIDAGKPLYETLIAMQRDYNKAGSDDSIKPLIDELLRRMRGGLRAGAPERRNIGTELEGLVPNTERMLIESGVASGRPAEGFRNAADYVTELKDLRVALLRGLTLPTIYMGVALAVLAFFGRKVFPTFEAITPRAQWPSEAQALATLGDHALLVVFFVASLVGMVAFVVLYLGPRWTGGRRAWCDRHVFPFTLMAAIRGAQFLTALKGYIRSGVPFADAIQDIGQNSEPYMRWQCRRVMRFLREGRSMDEAMISLSIVPHRYHWLITVYGGTEDPAASYITIAGEIMQRVKSLITAVFEKGLSAIMLASVGGMILWAYTSMLSIVDPFAQSR